MRTILFVALATTLMAGVALAEEPAKAGDSAKGKTLVDAKGMTLYTYDRDTAPGKSSCNGNCATNWPPLMATADAKPTGSWTVITRDDGGKQWAYKGKPLYYFTMDSAPGDKKGEGRGMVWHMAHM